MSSVFHLALFVSVWQTFFPLLPVAGLGSILPAFSFQFKSHEEESFWKKREYFWNMVTISFLFNSLNVTSELCAELKKKRVPCL